ncbi:hypothetical protein E2C01_053620 [Portunus trituberculatus]|uniref:Uncharacterized protein n=1 Tax=Portunus trituberculatus TaxID=210409 RepID=A0A5B7GPX7_PORTR|nr:hypothetical protein [Portunus trituberculatus]
MYENIVEEVDGKMKKETENSGFNTEKGFDVEIKSGSRWRTDIDEDRDVDVKEEGVKKEGMEEKERLAGVEVGQDKCDVVVERVLLKNHVAG